MNNITNRIHGVPLSILSVVLRMIAAIGVLGFFACVATPTVSEKATKGTHSMGLAVLPAINMSAIYGKNTSVRSPLTGKVFITGPVPEDAPMLLTDRIVNHLRDLQGYDVLPPGRTQGVYEKELAADSILSSDRNLVIRVGRSLGVDAVMVSHVYRFRGRQGNQYSAESPASVAFDLQMVLTDSGRVAWDGYADETQSALSDDLFQIGKFFQRKGRWISAEEMTDAALANMFESLP